MPEQFCGERDLFSERLNQLDQLLGIMESDILTD